MSIVLPTFNGERHLEGALRSCLAQTWRDLEVIVVVDGSTDRTRELLAGFSDDRLRVLDRYDNRGLPESLNEGFARAIGSYLTWSSDDNEYYPKAIERMLGVVATGSGTDFVYAAYEIVDAEGRVQRVVPARPPTTIWEDNCVGPCFLYSRAVRDRVGEYRPSERLIEDYDYWLRASRVCVMASLPDVLYRYTAHDASLTGRLNVLDRARRAARLKRRLGGITYPGLWRELARIDAADAFEQYAAGDYYQVPKLVSRAVLRDPRLLLNRGLLSILARSVHGCPTV